MKKLLYMIPAALVVLASCSKEEVPATVQEKVYPVSFSGTSILAKTSMGTASDVQAQMLWSKNDRVGLYVSTGTDASENAQNKPVVLVDGDTSGAGYEVGNFSTSLALSEGKTYNILIYYPWNGQAGTDASSISHNVPVRQYQGASGDNYGFNGGFAYAISRIDTPAIIQDGYAPEVPFTLSYQTAYAWLRVKTLDSALEGWRVRKVVLTAPEGTPLAGSFTFSLAENDEQEQEPVLTLGGDTSNEVVLNIGGDIALSAESYCDLRLTVLPAALAGKNLKITYTLEAADGSATRTLVHTRTLSATSLSFLAGNCSRFVEEIPAVQEDGWEISASAIDLSANETANSYIVSSAGDYSFDATVIGNGQRGVMLPTSTTHFHAETPAISPASASLVWQTSAGLITDIRLEDGRISFRKPGDAYGNALIAAKDSNGNIIWSWHIWCTDMGEAHVYLGTNGTYCVMDRNLGAVYASATNPGSNELWDKTLGLYYQWGRKDPFVGPYGLRNKGDATDNLELNGQIVAFAELYDAEGGVFARPEPISSTPELGTIAHTIANPALFIKGATSDWFYGGGDKKSGPTNRGYYFWGNPEGYNYATATPPAPKKTIYDPCPAGWMVPTGDVYKALGLKESAAYRGNVLTYDGINTTWYPRQGCMTYSTGVLNGQVGTVSYYWTSHFRHGTTYAAAALYISGSSKSESYYNTASAQPLRCMKEM